MCSKPRVFIVSISGSIGSGKTTVMKKLQNKKPDLQYFFENVSNWKFLPLFYQNPEQYALHFQLEILHQFQQMPKQGFLISERTTSDSKYIFAQCLLQDGLLSQDEWIFYEQNYNVLKIEPSVVIYLCIEPKQALKRIKERNRSTEQNISLEYLEKLEREAKKWLVLLEKQNVPIHFVDATQPMEKVFEQVYHYTQLYENLR